ncbi:polysaccharide biosynthesis/export family protein [Oscillatoria amoena NRMC-F 0135]|nr:polysaccharide biosynthesis/export family protein [Oscillatoria amoena NRMC-F 0135]
MGAPQQLPSTAPTPAPFAPLSSGIPNQAERLRPNYILQVGDQILIRAQDVEELTDRPFRIEPDGTINLPLVGRLKAAELTVEGLEAVIAQALRQFVVNPQVTVVVTQFKSDPVFVVGAFRAPGIYPLQTRRTLVELLSSVGGLAPNSSRRIRVTRRIEAGIIPLSAAVVSSDGKYSSVEINIQTLQTSVNAPEDLVLEAYDVISAERAEMIYTTGAIARIGGIELGDRESLSVVQVLSLSGGLSPLANRKVAYVFRPVLDTARRAQIRLDLQKITRGESNDFPLLPNDVLFIPDSRTNALLSRGAQIAIAVGTSALIFWVIGQR